MHSSIHATSCQKIYKSQVLWYYVIIDAAASLQRRLCCQVPRLALTNSGPTFTTENSDVDVGVNHFVVVDDVVEDLEPQERGWW